MQRWAALPASHLFEVDPNVNLLICNIYIDIIHLCIYLLPAHDLVIMFMLLILLYITDKSRCIWFLAVILHWLLLEQEGVLGLILLFNERKTYDHLANECNRGRYKL